MKRSMTNQKMEVSLIKGKCFARKAGYHYGWDWGPRLVTSGIWKPVYIEAWDGMKITDVFLNNKK